ncbi:VanZ family protein [Agromyces bauzanensis]
MNRRPLRFFALGYALAVLWLTVGPAPWRTSGNQLDGGILNPDAWTATVTWTTGYLAEMAFNVAMFVPVGVLAALLIPRRRWPFAVVAGFAFTALIELVQVPAADRISDPRDLVMNASGAVFGVLLVLVARGVRRAAAVASHVPDTADATTGLRVPAHVDDDEPGGVDHDAVVGATVSSPTADRTAA